MKMLSLRAFVALFSVAAAAPVCAVSVMGGAGDSVLYAKGKSADAPKRRLTLSQVHEALDGSRLHDDTCLVFRVNNCDVFIFADEEGSLRHVLIRFAGRGGAREKRRAAVEEVQKALQRVLGESAPPEQLVSTDGALLMYSEPSVAYGKTLICGVDRCRAIDELLALGEDAELLLKKTDAMGLTLELAYEEELAPEITLDLTRPVVEYVELRASDKCSKKKLNAKVLSLFSDIKQSKAEDKYSRFGRGDKAVETWWTNGTHYLARNKRLYLVGSAKCLNSAVDRGVDYKVRVVELPDLSSYKVELPEVEIMPPAPELEEEPALEIPLTPAEARKEYIKMLKNM